MLLGPDNCQRLINDTAGTYFVERDLILNFKADCLEPLELSDPQMRQYYFQNHRRMLYLRQPSDPDLIPKAMELAAFLNLNLTIRDADYKHLKEILSKLL